jgi:UDP-glucose 4-epimerase
MNFLITGGAGSVGSDLTTALLRKGHRVKVFDRKTRTVGSICDDRLEWIEGRLENAPLVQEAIRGVDVVIHLAWSFSDDPAELLECDLKGHVILLDACVAAKVKRLFYTSTAVVYGKPVQVPIIEESPCLVEEARKPFYAIAKQAAEKLTLVYWKMQGLPVTIFRFWWSYGEKIGGRHLRDMITLALKGLPLMVPEKAGGSFLDHKDMIQALYLAVEKQESVGQIFNLATLYQEWKDIARMIIEVTGSTSSLEVIPAGEWAGAPFLADSWELSIAKAQRLFDYQPLLSPAIARQRLAKAIARGREGINGH